MSIYFINKNELLVRQYLVSRQVITLSFLNLIVFVLLIEIAM
jgi:hypothetical protein